MTDVVKADGAVEAFDVEKLRRSLERAGASPRDIERVTRAVEKRLYDGMSTRELYRAAFRELRRRERVAAARYSLKRALLSMGPSGYPFERLMGAVMEARGYTSRVGVVLEGHFVSHEVDVVADRTASGGTPAHRVLMECKYHSSAERKCDVKVSLYVYARALDLLDHVPRADAQFWLVTNTRFTSDAVRYGSSSGLELVSWDYPERGCLPALIEAAGVHPLTCLTTLRKHHKRALLDAGLVLACEVRDRPDLHDEAGLRRSEFKAVLDEISGLPHPTQ